MGWNPYYRGDGNNIGAKLPDPPPWRVFPAKPNAATFQPPPGLVDAVNAALHLRRPLLLTGAPGSGKSSVIESIAAELALGTPLRWHITSRTTLVDGLYRYDVLGRVHAQQFNSGDESQPFDIAEFLQLGPLGTALLPRPRTRALLIDEFDKSDFDLPGDLLDILERGEFEIPELGRHKDPIVEVREWGTNQVHSIERGRVRSSNFPVIVITSNGEREFAAPFLRRCVRFQMPRPSTEFLQRVVAAHLGEDALVNASTMEIIASFLERVQSGDNIAIDQLLNAVYLLSGEGAPDPDERSEILELLLRELSRA